MYTDVGLWWETVGCE